MTVLLLLSTPVTVKPIACVEMKDEKSNSILPTEATRLRPRLESFDDVLPYVGDYGRYQWLLLLSLLPYGATYAFLYFSQFFITIIPTEHWCRIDELVNSNFTEEESWYVSNGMMDKVVEKLRRIARINRRNPDSRIYDILVSNMEAPDKIQESATLLDLFKTPRLARNTILLVAFWCFTLISFDDHVYSLKLIQSSVFVSFSIACATELPAGLLLALLLDRWGRRLCGFLTMAMTCVLSIAELMLHSMLAKLVMSILSRFCLNMAANVGLQYAAELLPTPVRSQGVSFIHIFGIVAHSLAPYITDSAAIWEGFPMLIISTVSFFGAALVLFLPETVGQNLPQTIKQGEEFGRDQHFWSLPCYHKTHFNGHQHYHSCER
ncbi:solute carrier family 22 member 3-like isoform X1 [Bombus huntii]|uniref:solute carrier family 22 member 3-like isoform X1 n=2 Tax=Bombus huntii TaxID=85661 RepID=UPI0021AA0DF5|nr:solute carrier family 22 member 3-like isoform X1 [Bombus huntii]